MKILLLDLGDPPVFCTGLFETGNVLHHSEATQCKPRKCENICMHALDGDLTTKDCCVKITVSVRYHNPKWLKK